MGDTWRLPWALRTRPGDGPVGSSADGGEGTEVQDRRMRCSAWGRVPTLTLGLQAVCALEPSIAHCVMLQNKPTPWGRASQDTDITCSKCPDAHSQAA